MNVAKRGSKSVQFAEFDEPIPAGGMHRTALWFERSGGDSGVLVYRLEEDRYQRLIGIDDHSGALLWQRPLSSGVNRCVPAGRNFVCVSRPSPGSISGWTSEVTTIRGDTGATLSTHEFSYDKEVDDIVVGATGLYVLTHERSGPAWPATLYKFSRDHLRPQWVTRIGSDTDPDDFYGWSFDLSQATSTASLTAGFQIFQFRVGRNPPRNVRARVVDILRRESQSIGDGVDLVRETVANSDRVWSIETADRAVHLGQGQPWRAYGPGEPYRLGSLGFNDLDLHGQVPKQSRLKSRPMTDSYIFRSPVPGQVIIETDDALVGRDVNTGATSWRVDEHYSLLNVSVARDYFVMAGDGLRVFDLRGRVIAGFPAQELFVDARPTITPTGFVVARGGHIRGYAVSD